MKRNAIPVLSFYVAFTLMFTSCRSYEGTIKTAEKEYTAVNNERGSQSRSVAENILTDRAGVVGEVLVYSTLRQILNAEPTPGVLSTEMLPSNIVTIRFTNARPRPLPCIA